MANNFSPGQIACVRSTWGKKFGGEYTDEFIEAYFGFILEIANYDKQANKLLDQIMINLNTEQRKKLFPRQLVFSLSQYEGEKSDPEIETQLFDSLRKLLEETLPCGS